MIKRVKKSELLEQVYYIKNAVGREGELDYFMNYFLVHQKM